MTRIQAGSQVTLLPDGRRLHLNHGPIDLIVEAFGDISEVHAAHDQAAARFPTILGELVEELPMLRSAASSRPRDVRGAIARRMEAAVRPLAHEHFITPMAAVAGSVADEILTVMLDGRTLQKAYVNNGGDSAFFLAPGQSMKLAVAGTGNGFADRVLFRAEDPARGVATSGWRGRSFSLGIADAVTVLARSGAEADAAATIIANAVDLPGHSAIRREPASSLAPDSDLGDLHVTTGVAALSACDVAAALEAGLSMAETLLERGLIEAAALFLNRDIRLCGALPTPQPISPRVGEMAGRPEGGAIGRKALRQSNRPETPHA
jgi:ApbE superfamily uncharacterized protein (UPF0280 family)